MSHWTLCLACGITFVGPLVLQTTHSTPCVVGGKFNRPLWPHEWSQQKRLQRVQESQLQVQRKYLDSFDFPSKTMSKLCFQYKVAFIPANIDFRISLLGRFPDYLMPVLHFLPTYSTLWRANRFGKKLNSRQKIFIERKSESVQPHVATCVRFNRRNDSASLDATSKAIDNTHTHSMFVTVNDECSPKTWLQQIDDLNTAHMSRHVFSIKLFIIDVVCKCTSIGLKATAWSWSNWCAGALWRAVVTRHWQCSASKNHKQFVRVSRKLMCSKVFFKHRIIATISNGSFECVCRSMFVARTIQKRNRGIRSFSRKEINVLTLVSIFGCKILSVVQDVFQCRCSKLRPECIWTMALWATLRNTHRSFWFF